PRVRKLPPRLDDAVDLVLSRLVLVGRAGFGERHGHRRGGAAALARVCFVDNDREGSAAVLGVDLVEDYGEFLHGADDDLLAALEESAQIARVLGVADGRTDLGELFDSVSDLFVEISAVSD